MTAQRLASWEAAKNSARVPARAGNFTADAHVTGLAFREQPSLTGAGTAWHRHPHPRGRTPVLIAGRGWPKCDGAPTKEAGPDNIDFRAPGRCHRHGTAPDSRTMHVAVQRASDGTDVAWRNKATDAEYRAEGD